MRTSPAIGICLGIFAVYLPVALWVHRDYDAPPRPTGMAEQIVQFHPNEHGYWATRSRGFNEKSITDAKSIAVLEDMKPLPVIDAYLDTGYYIVRFKTSDGSDPNKNGKNYWVVQN